MCDVDVSVRNWFPTFTTCFLDQRHSARHACGVVAYLTAESTLHFLHMSSPVCSVANCQLTSAPIFQPTVDSGLCFVPAPHRHS